LKIIYTSQFKRDYKRIKKQHKNLTELRTMIGKLANGKKPGAKHKDHGLTGNLKGFRDCHLEPDRLLIYTISSNILFLERTGSHSELFK